MPAAAGVRWTQVRLVITRSAGAAAVATLVLRQSDNRTVWDRRLDTVVFPAPPGSGVSRSVVLALVEAVVALAGKRGELSLLTGTAAEQSASLEGPQGVEGQLRLDLPGYNQKRQPPPTENSRA